MLIAIGAFLGGCDSTSPTTPVTFVPSAFTGNFGGSYTAIGLESGTMTVVIGTSGAIEGNVNSTGFLETGLVTGNISQQGKCNMNVSLPMNDSTAMHTVVVKNTDGSITGAGTEVYHGKTYPLSFTLTVTP